MSRLAARIQMDQPPRPSPDTESRDRAGSSDPCATRPNPFDDDDGSSARKRRRTSANGASSSRSIDTPSDSSSPPTATEGDPASVDKDHCADVTMTIDAAASEPQTPEQQHGELPPASESKPKRVTLNLKSKKEIARSESSSPMSLNDLLLDTQVNGIRLSVEDDELDNSGLHAQFLDTASSALDETDNRPIEIIDDDDDDDSSDDQGAVLMVSNGLDKNPMILFPYYGDPIVDCLPRLSNLMQTGKIAAIYCTKLFADKAVLQTYARWSFCMIG